MTIYSRDETLALLSGRPLSRFPVFSGLPSLTASGLRAVGVRYAEAHTDADKMARAAASTFEQFGFESAVAPFDLCVEAEALGGRVDFHTDVDAFLPPVVIEPLPIELLDNGLAQIIPADATRAGRIQLIADALRRLKGRVGREVAIGAWIPGPFTLAWQLFGSETWLASIGDSTRVAPALGRLAVFLARVAGHYRESGADFLTVHEMGGSPQAIGPRAFQTLVGPALQALMSRLPSPKVLSMCGDTNGVVEALAACGADALSVDQRNDLAHTRQRLGAKAVLLGNFDPVGVLSLGTPQSIAETVASIVATGANAIWPGCDLWPDIPEANFRALMAAARNLKT
jgi:[methyl-Co(III) methanol-specific corrinoid protein]:coenzyme M methyltransferase